MSDEMAAWMKYAQPAKEHEYLNKMEGTWKADATFWMQPGEPPMKAEGKVENRLILGGRFLQTNYDTEMMGAPFQGMAIDGYDVLNEKYVGLWIDTMGTMMLVFEGTVSGNTREMFAEHTSPMTGQPTKMKGVTTIIDENTHRYEGWNAMPDGEFHKSMEVIYTRI